MPYLLILVSIVIFTFQTISFKEFNKKYMKNLGSYFLFNFCYFTISVLMLFMLGGFNSLQPYTLWLGISFGILFVGTILVYMKAMEIGPLSYTTLFFAFGLLVPIVFGLFFWDESISLWQFIGLLLLLVTFYLGNDSSGNEEQKWSGKWLTFCVLAFISNGTLMVMSKGHQILLPEKELNEFLIIGFGTSAIFSLILFIWKYFWGKEGIKHFKSLPLGGVIVIAGVSTAIGNWLVLYLATKIPSVVQFPSVNGGIVLLSTLVSSVLYKEKLSKKL